MFLKKKKFWGSVIAVALLAYVIKDIRLSEIQELGGRLNYYYLIPSIITSFLFIITKALRWKIILASQKTISYGRAIALFSAGQILNIVMPVLTGQVGRLFLFSKHEGIRKAVLFSTVLLEILFDAISLVIFLFLTSLAFAFPEEYRQLSLTLLIISTIAVSGLYLIIHNQTKIEDFGKRHLRDRVPSFYVGGRKFIRSFTKGMDLLRSSHHIMGSMIYSLLSWAVHTLVVYFLLKAFGFELPFAAAAAIMIINTLAVMIPITPGNAGTFELAVSSSLAAFSVGKSDAVLFAIALHLLDLIPIFAMGFLFLRYEKVSINEIRTEHEDDTVLDRVNEEGSFVEDQERV